MEQMFSRLLTLTGQLDVEQDYFPKRAKGAVSFLGSSVSKVPNLNREPLSYVVLDPSRESNGNLVYTPGLPKHFIDTVVYCGKTKIRCTITPVTAHSMIPHMVFEKIKSENPEMKMNIQPLYGVQLYSMEKEPLHILGQVNLPIRFMTSLEAGQSHKPEEPSTFIVIGGGSAEQMECLVGMSFVAQYGMTWKKDCVIFGEPGSRKEKVIPSWGRLEEESSMRRAMEENIQRKRQWNSFIL